MQSVEGMRGVFQQEMQSLKAERSQLREALHDVKWAASQAAGPHQAAVSLCQWCCWVELALILICVLHVGCYLKSLRSASVQPIRQLVNLAKSSLQQTGTRCCMLGKQTDRHIHKGSPPAGSQQDCT